MHGAEMAPFLCPDADSLGRAWVATSYAPIPDEQGLVLQEIARIRQQLAQHGVPDAQEMAERTDAAQAYAGESPRHFVDYVDECVRTSSTATREVRAMQRQCWDLYQEKEPPNYASKQEWQSQAVLPKPYAAVQFAVAMVQAAFSPQFLSIKEEPSHVVSAFWTRLMQRQLDEQHANFVVRFSDASEMGFAVGQSFEMIPIWDTQRRCLTYALVEPWKIHRDPDALNREPQSGMYWIHEEYMDYWVLRQGEQAGRYQHTAGLHNLHSQPSPNNHLTQQPEAARLRQYVYQRNKYRHAVLTREFWGTVLAPGGELLLPSATYTVAGDRVIADPAPSPYTSLRWPGVSFSPLPHLLRFEGRSLLQSVRSLWYLMCNLLSMHADYQNWIVNPMREVNIRGLVDQDDIDPYPGKVYQTRDTVSGQMVCRTVDQRFITNDIMANEQWLDQTFQRGTMVNDVVQGLPGYRQEITARESAQHLAQSKTAFAKMGGNLDVGAIQAILAGMETLLLNVTMDDIALIFPEDQMQELGQMVQPKEDGTLNLPPLQGHFHVSGLQTVMEEQAELQAIQELIVPMSTHPVFGPYIRPFNVAKAIESRANLEDEKLFIDDKEAEQMMQQKSQEAQEMQDLQKQLLQAQVQALQAKGQADMARGQIEQAKAQAQAQQAQVDMMIAQLEGETAQIEHATERERMQQDLARIGAEITQIMHQLQMDEGALEVSQVKAESQLAKIAATVAMHREQMQVERERIAMEHEKARLMAQRPRSEV